jgi:hypothetical protein
MKSKYAISFWSFKETNSKKIENLNKHHTYKQTEFFLKS